MSQNCTSTGCDNCGSIDMGIDAGSENGNDFYSSDFLEMAKKRFSVRKYRDTRVEDNKIRSIIEAGRVAPTAANQQPYKIISIRTSEGIGKLSLGATTFGATSAFIICADLNTAW